MVARGQATEAMLRREEERLGVRLGDALRRTLRWDNGFELELRGALWVLHPVFDDSSRQAIARTCDHLARVNQHLRESPLGELVPEAHLAIASSQDGDLLLSPVRDDALAEEVWLWGLRGGALERVVGDVEELLEEARRDGWAR